ncbi:hypothetical protein A9G41_00415 [Gilliamella sp. Nev5-1]|uniref:YbhB/YbcL family Raf kinase inhibitor-like protein n=1 Tax=unclassified Gilliamella TaxID=2685620 RepID=UPI00080EB829|nr:YbhB/YbcL family Raf kinase inhibitor-like protein [Gilliamella apicola]OCG60757.1 hypothetical protein A9G40_03525 [Gilliamella apicola]OCG70340.1 hypothetical protein A9G41_00415 [Gilliamella apicola]
MHILCKAKAIIYSTLLLSTSCSYATQLQLTSTDLINNGFTTRFISNQFGCQGENISPQISWKNLPKTTKSLVLTMYDPDAPTGSGWWHWVIVNIPVQTSFIKQSAGNNPNLLPKGSRLVRNDFGVINYGGPCPPLNSTHRYQFTLYALDIDHIEVDEQTTPALVGFIANSHQIAKADIIYSYSR